MLHISILHNLEAQIHQYNVFPEWFRTATPFCSRQGKVALGSNSSFGSTQKKIYPLTEKAAMAPQSQIQIRESKNPKHQWK